jgi:hypothetical protein
MSLKPLLLTICLLLASASGRAFDLETFRSLDPAELRSAEARMDEFLEPGTARLLREPRNASERYLVERQQRLAEAFNRRGATKARAEGETVQGLFWPAARASRLAFDADGRAIIQCQPAQTLLGSTPPDFRAGNASVRPSR